MKYSVDRIVESLTKERLGGICYFSICGAGETLLPHVTLDIVHGLLSNGHYVNLTTNGTLNKRFDELISILNPGQLERLHFSFSLHYIELKRVNKLYDFASNVKKIKKSGCSFCVQLNLCDAYIQFEDEIKSFCNDHFGANPQVAATREEKNISRNVKLFTDYTTDEYIEKGQNYKSPLFDFTMKNFNVARREFCYAGYWSFTLNLASGVMHRCYACNKGYDIFKEPSKSISFVPIGKHCKSLFCLNSSHFMSLGVIPSVDTPSYASLRNRNIFENGSWYTEAMNNFLSQKLEENNDKKYNLLEVEKSYLQDELHGVLAKIYRTIFQEKV